MRKEIRSFEIVEEFEASTSQLFVIFSDEARWPEGSISRILVSRSPSFVQVAFTDLSRAAIELAPIGAGKSQMTLKHELLATVDAQKLQERFWSGYLKEIRKQVEH